MNNDSLNNSSMLPIGSTLNGKYTITKHLSSRPFGNIYVANDLKFRENVLIKELFIQDISRRNSDGLSVDVKKGFVEIYEEYIDTTITSSTSEICLMKTTPPIM